jgi:hypothetical protein
MYIRVHTQVALTTGRALRVRDAPAYRAFQDALAAGGYSVRASLQAAMQAARLDPALLDTPLALLPGQPGSSDQDCAAVLTGPYCIEDTRGAHTVYF